jgi:N6-L-threonylcarbamoyladenine synthase
MAYLTLGIETSCDETAAAVLEDGRRVRSSVIASQDALHGPYGGVVPELASRRHVEAILPVVREALHRPGVILRDLDGIAVTAGPGLIGSLLVGLSFGKALAFALDIPLVGVNHLEGHLYAALLEHDGLNFPFTGLIVSGGHTHLYSAEAHGDYRLLGRTRDDAAGEAFDKVAKLLGLGYPGGPAVEEQARKGDPTAIRLPKPMRQQNSYDFSFSGLKTAVARYVKGRASLDPACVADICASFQGAVVEALTRVTVAAAKTTASGRIVLSGGVACNGRLRSELTQAAADHGIEVYYPSPSLCTDNAAMIAAAGYPRLQRGERAPLSFNADPDLALALT